MSEDFANIQTFVTTLVTNLKENVTRAGDGKGGLFPNGVNDIYAKITIGGVHLELEISSAELIHTEPTAPPKRIEPPDDIKIDAYVRPMYVTIPTGQDNAPVNLITSYTSQKTGHKIDADFNGLTTGNHVLDIG